MQRIPVARDLESPVSSISGRRTTSYHAMISGKSLLWSNVRMMQTIESGCCSLKWTGQYEMCSSMVTLLVFSVLVQSQFPVRSNVLRSKNGTRDQKVRILDTRRFDSLQIHKAYTCSIEVTATLRGERDLVLSTTNRYCRTVSAALWTLDSTQYDLLRANSRAPTCISCTLQRELVCSSTHPTTRHRED
jgi:hypothetical protein